MGRSGHHPDKGQPARETTRTMEIEPPPRAGVDAIASAICEAGRSRSRSEESPNAVETIPVEEDGVDALMREAATVLGRAAQSLAAEDSPPQVVKRKRHQRTPSLVDAAAVLAGVSEAPPPRDDNAASRALAALNALDPKRKETPPPPPVAIVTPDPARLRGRYRCSRCGEPKANHVCKGAQRYERSVAGQTVGLEPKDVKKAGDKVLTVRAWTPARARPAPKAKSPVPTPPRVPTPPPPRVVVTRTPLPVAKRPRAASTSPMPLPVATPSPGLLFQRPRANSMSPPGLPLLPRPRAGSLPGLPLFAPTVALPWACPCGKAFGFGPRGSPPALAWVAHARQCGLGGRAFPPRPPPVPAARPPPPGQP